MKRKLFFLILSVMVIFALTAVTASAADEAELKVLELVNIERAANGLDPLQWSDDVYAAAKIRANEVLEQFSHTRPNGASFSTAFGEVGLRYSYAAENIAYGYSTPEAVVKAWMDSPSHKANILSSKVKYLGVAKVSGGSYSPAWTQEFFTPSGSYEPSNPQVTPSPSPSSSPSPSPEPSTPPVTSEPNIPGTPGQPSTPTTPSTPSTPGTSPDCVIVLIPPSAPGTPAAKTPRYQPPEWDNSLQQYVPESWLTVWLN